MLGPNGEELPGAILFACNFNAVRSPMAEAIMKYLYGTIVYVDSCGVRTGELDPFAVEVMDELGIEIENHTPKSFDDLEDTFYDLVISLTPQAQHKAVEMTRTMSVEIEYWAMLDPTATQGNREQMLDSYRATRDLIMTSIKNRFATKGGPNV